MMKKLLSSKKIYENGKATAFPLSCDPPKRTVTSTWNVRNDSSNINSILQPDNYIRSPQKDNNQGVYKKCLLGDNTCYCREKKIRPKLLSKPKSCPTQERLKKKYLGSGNLLRHPWNQLYTLYDCRCKGDGALGSLTVSTNMALPKAYQDLVDSCSCLKYTQPRQDYHLYREMQDEQDLRQMDNYNQLADKDKEGGKNEADYYNQLGDKDRRESKLDGEYYGDLKDKDNWERKGVNYSDLPYKEKGKSQYKGEGRNGENVRHRKVVGEDYSASTLGGTRQDVSNIDSKYLSRDQGKAVDDLNAFRGDHYFDTHSTDDLAKDAPSHTCIHQFRLDDRLLPQPLNVDAYGRSRCSICSKPMDGDTMHLSKSYFGDRPSSESLRKLSRGSELGLSARSVIFGGSRSRIELIVDSDEGKKDMLVTRIRRPEYFNTYALRQQRMSW